MSTLTITIGLAAPQLLFPETSSSVPPGVCGVWLEWAPVAGANHYEIEITCFTVEYAPDGQPCVASSVARYVSKSSPYQVYVDGTVHWRVRAFDADGDAGPWSATWMFAVQ